MERRVASAGAEASPFSFSDTRSGTIATLAILPVIWALMVVVMRVLSSTIEPVYCVLWSQVLTLPFFLGALGGGPLSEGGETLSAMRRVPGGEGGVDDELRRTVGAGAVLGTLWALGALVQNTGFAYGASASHGAFLTQMTTLLVPTASMLRGDVVPTKFLYACALALPGIAAFTSGPHKGASMSLQLKFLAIQCVRKSIHLSRT